MAIMVSTSGSDALLKAIYKAIDSGAIATWSYDDAGDFTHTPPQWKFKAWLTPVKTADSLNFGLLGKKSVNMTTEVYAVYHGRFIEMLLAHFDDRFSTATASAKGQMPPDNF